MSESASERAPAGARTARKPCVAVIGAGPAGLMAAEVLADGGAQVEVFDAMPSAGRKLLLAGIGGLNLTHSEPLEHFVRRYRGSASSAIVQAVRAFGPQELRAWAAALGIETFVGSSGRVFPREMKAAPLLRAWLARLRSRGVRLHARHRWTGWSPADPAVLSFSAPEREGHVTLCEFRPDATVLALGGASWPKLGSDGAWQPELQSRGVAVAPLRAANSGFDIAPVRPGEAHWSALLRERHAGEPVKPVAAWVGSEDGAHRQPGEFVLTETGVEGSLVYALSFELREAIEREGHATLWLDLLPQIAAERMQADLAAPRGKRSLAVVLQRIGLSPLKRALLHEVLSREALGSAEELSRAIKALPLRLQAARPVAEAISTAGGVHADALIGHGRLRALPTIYCAGEMLDWEAPTGGYLLTACMASGRAVGVQVLADLP